ncbi:MAG: nitrate/nitrite transporter NrtS [Woeseiaceae bacterium]
MTSWLKIAVRKDVVLRGLKVGGIVGTILVAINQGDLLLAGTVPVQALWKILLTYCVPYCVSTYASVSAIRSVSE